MKRILVADTLQHKFCLYDDIEMMNCYCTEEYNGNSTREYLKQLEIYANSYSIKIITMLYSSKDTFIYKVKDIRNKKFKSKI
jgi:hypothetical protein